MELIIDRFIELEADRSGWNDKWTAQADAHPELVETIPLYIADISIGKRHMKKVGRTGIILNRAEYNHPELFINNRLIIHRQPKKMIHG